jgi:phosphatidate cytidylyltransferase
MPLNIQTLKTRSLTALVFVAVMLVGLLWNFWSFVVLFTIIHFGCWLEYGRLVTKISSSKIDNFIINYFAFCGVTLMYVLGQSRVTSSINWQFFGLQINLKYSLWALLFIGLLIFLFQNKKINTKLKWQLLVGFIYIALPFTSLLNLRASFFLTNKFNENLYFGKVVVCAVISSIWINDTMAYIVGSLIGKTPFSKISPKKTWEGTIGGALLCIIVIYFLGVMLSARGIVQQSFIKHAAIIAALCAIFGTLGDLFESKLKRLADVKDSGTIMPGHGGFLDRFDSLLFAAPVVWVYVRFFM